MLELIMLRLYAVKFKSYAQDFRRLGKSELADQIDQLVQEMEVEIQQLRESFYIKEFIQNVSLK